MCVIYHTCLQYEWTKGRYLRISVGKIHLNSNTSGIFQINLMDPTRIRVVVRKRPLSKKEKCKSDVDIIEDRGTQTVAVKELK